MKNVKKLFLIFLFALSLPSVSAYVVSDMIHTALTKITQWESSIKQAMQLTTTVKDYKQKIEQIKTYYEQLKSLDWSKLDNIKKGLLLIAAIDDSIENMCEDMTKEYDDLKNKYYAADKKFLAEMERTKKAFEDDAVQAYRDNMALWDRLTRAPRQQKMWEYQKDARQKEIDFFQMQKKIYEERIEEDKKNFEERKKAHDENVEEMKKDYEKNMENLQGQLLENAFAENDSDKQIAQKAALRQEIQGRIDKSEEKYKKNMEKLSLAYADLEKYFDSREKTNKAQIAMLNRRISEAEKDRKKAENNLNRY